MADSDKPGAAPPAPRPLLGRPAVDLGPPMTQLADSIAATSPAGAKEFHATPDARAVRGGPAPTAGRFGFDIDRDPALLGRAFLVYDLAGLSSFSAAVRSINGARPLGGFRPVPASAGGVQVEELPIASLRRGPNQVEFLPTSRDDVVGYEVSHLRVVFVADPVAARDTAHPDLVIVHPLHGECSGGMTYVRGFVTPAANPSGLATVLIDGKLASSALESDGEFSIGVQPPNQESSSFSFEVSARYPDGTSVSRPVTVDGCSTDGGLAAAALSSMAHARGKLVDDPNAPYGAVVTPWAPKTLSYGGATIEIPAGAVEKTTRITIRPLPASQLAKMNEGMKNVTPGAGGFRFGPHGLTFNAPVTIKLPVDDALLPAGKVHNDVGAYFFDEQDYRWKAVGRAKRDGKTKGRTSTLDDGRVASQTTHFTDFVNATLAVPEHPTAESFNENTMKDMKLGDPAAGLTLIEPPSANAFGSANLAYPIEVPPGRNGVQPQLSIRYNSDNTQNGWLGVGWDLTLPSIEVDTRFGAPAYDPASETESYLFDGEALAPTAKLDNPDPRSGSQKTFFRRVEGKFDKIVRFGDKPENYYWVVTDQRGTQFTFGKTAPPATGTDTSARLQAYQGAPAPGIFRWYLEKVVDTFGNEMDVSYFHDTFRDDAHNAEPYTQTYPQSITYTSSAPNNLAPAYSVVFDLQPRCDVDANGNPTSNRCDQIITGKPGFQVKTNFRLQDIRVLQGATPQTSHQIRRYNLSYLDGDFHKSLLSSIEQVGENGGSLGVHNFYYNLLEQDPRLVQNGTGVGADVYNLFDDAKPWGTVHRNDGGLSHSDDQTKGGSIGGGLGIGPISGTVSGGGFSGDETPHITFLDQNGDGLPDLLDDGGQGSFNFLKTRGSPPTGDFFSTFPIPPSAGSPPPFQMSGFLGEKGLGHTDRSGWTVQGGISLGGFLGGDIGYSHESTDDDHLVSDIDGDGFPDLIQVGDDDVIKVALNDGHRGYNALANFGEIDRSDLTPSHKDRDDKVAVAASAVDPLIRWVAPFDVVGTVSLSAPIRKLKTGGDGVTGEIWTQSGAAGIPALLWHHTIDLNDTTTCFPVQGCDPQTNCAGLPAGASDACAPSGALAVPVGPGTRIYTKLDSGKDSHHDDVSWDPTITYTASVASQQSLREPYGPFAYQFSQSNDHRLAGADARWTASADGTVNVTGAIASKLETLDDVTAHLILTHVNQQKQEVGLSAISRTATGPQTVSFTGISVKKDESLTLQVDSDTKLDTNAGGSIVDSPDNFIITPLDPERALVAATVSYQTFSRFDPKTGVVLPPAVVTCNANPSLGCTIAGDPLPKNPIPFDVINQTIEPFYPTVTYLAHPPTAGAFKNASVSIGGQINNPTLFPIVAVAEGVNHQIYKTVVPAGGNLLVPPGTTGTTTDEVVFSIYTVNDPLALIGTPSWSATLDGAAASANLRQPDPDFGVDGAGNPKDVMAGGYHSFFYGDWIGDVPFTAAPFAMTFSAVFNQPPTVVPAFMFLAPLEESRDTIPPIPPSTANPPAWVGRGAGEYIAAAEQKPARLKGFGTTGHGLSAVDGLRESTTTNVDTSLSVTVVNAGINKGQTTSEIDFLDMNGDRFPDSVYMDGVRFNSGTQLGGKSGPASAVHFDFGGLGDMRRVEHGTGRLGAKFSEDSQDINETDTAGNPSKTISTGFQFGIDYGLSSTEIDVVDINGDGLPDHLLRQRGDAPNPFDNAVVVQLNLGHSFSRPIAWPTAAWQLGPPGGGIAQSILNFLSSDTMSTTTLRLQDTIGDNIGGGVDANIVGGGGGRNVTQTRTFIDLVDVNGDGMPDQVFRNPGGDLRVKLNLGDRFATEQAWGIQAHWPVSIEDTDIQADIGNAVSGATGADHDPDALAFTRGSSLSGSFSIKICVIACITGSAFYSQGSSSSQMGFEDIDGDGKLDHVLKLDDNSVVYAKRNHVEKSNLLVGIDRPLTGDHADPNAPHTIALGYARDGNRVSSTGPGVPNNPDMPNNQWILTSVNVNDGQGKNYSTSFAYGDGIYNRGERENQGYDTVTTTRPDGSKIVERFVNGNQDTGLSGVAQSDSFYARGRLYDRVEQDSAAHVFARTTTKWVVALSDRSDQNAPPVPRAAFLEDSADATYFYDGTKTDLNAFGTSTHRTRLYDGFGNVTDFTDFGEEGTSADDAVYHVGYFNNPSLYVIRPNLVTAKDSANNLLRERDATYGSLGELLSLTNTLIGGTDPTTNAPYSGGSNPVWSFTYDAFGNVSSVTSPGKTAADQHKVSYLYDDTAKTYRKQTTDENFHYVSTSIPNLDFGAVDTTTDINGQSEHYVYDQFGRLSQVFGPRDIGASSPTIAIDYSLPAKAVSAGSPAYAVTHHKDEQHAGDPIDTAVFEDGLKRVLQTKKDLEDDNGTGVTQVGFVVSGNVAFDARGRVSDQSQPRFCTPAGDADCDQGPNNTPADITTYIKSQRDRNPTHFDYDLLSRILLVRTPDQAVTTTSYGFGTPGGDPIQRRAKTVTDPNNKVRIFYQSVRDEIVAVQEQNTFGGQSKTLLTQYTYDPLSEVLTVTDAKNNPTTATYDTLGQMVSLNNRDTGIVNYRFDLAGNLAAKETPNLHAANQLIRRVYDHGRLTDVVYPTSKSVHFTYGAENPTPGLPNDANGNVAGRIAAVDDESGHHEFLYGSMGELVQESRRLFSVRNELHIDDRVCDPQNCDQDGNPLNQFEHDCSKPPTYVTKYTRDSFDRLLELVYPDGEDMTYQYDKGGSLNSVSSLIPVPNTTQCQLRHAQPTTAHYVNHIGYDEFGQRENIYLGNGVTTSYAYDPQVRRLTNVNTNRPDKDSHGNPIVVPLQRLAYTYDPVGNVISMSNNIAAPTQENFTGPTAFLFAYDDLYQLTGASATYTRETNNLHTEFRQQNLSVTYDEIGNVTSKVQIDTDHIDGLTNVEDDTSRAWDYSYAASGPHQVSQIKWRDPQPSPLHQTFKGAHRDYQYDLDGNDKRFDFIEKGETHSEADRVLTWNEEDRLRSAGQDGIHIDDTTQSYLYDSDGTRTQRRIGSGICPDETKYVNQYVVVQNDDVTSKHIYAGDTRVATTLTNEETQECQDPQPVFYFHTDHLQSTEYLTDSAAKIAEHNEYFAYGETWIDERRDLDNDGRQDYLFTAKEIDPETNLYYFGARYYDPMASRWETPDPVLAQLFSGRPNGGVFFPQNLGVYGYTHQNPIKLVDPDGKSATLIGALVGGAVGGAVAWWHGEDARHIAGAAVQGAIQGAIVGSVIDTGGGSLAVIGASAAANVGGGIVGRLVSGDEQSLKAVGIDAAAGAAGGVAGVAAGKVVEGVAGALARTAANEGGTVAETTATEAAHPTFKPGPHAGKSIPARSTAQKFTAAERAQINEIGETTGCHTCGVKTPGTKTGNFVPDHQPPSALNPDGAQQRLYPQCINCSRDQGLAIARMKRGQ